MTTRRLRVLCTALGPWLATASLLAAPIGQPTPPPCAADGACVPARATWGYHRTQWRLWPGTSIDPAAPGEDSAVGGEYIGPTAKPDPAVEDKQAPPKVEALDPEPEAAETGESDFELPEMDAEQGVVPEETPEPDPLAPPRPGFMDRVPGGLPFGEPADDAAPARPGTEPELPFGQPPATPPTDLFPSNTHGRPTGPTLGDDRPPALPFAIQQSVTQQPTQLEPARGFVQPAAAYDAATPGRARVARIPVEAPRTRVERAAGASQLGDAPPHMPQGLFGNR